MASERSSRGAFSSLSALWKQVGHKKIYSSYERLGIRSIRLKKLAGQRVK